MAAEEGQRRLDEVGDDVELLHERRRMLLRWLRSLVNDDEAEGMASAGHRPLPCGGCGRAMCEACKRDPSETVRGNGRAGGGSHDPRFVRAIVARASRFPAGIVIRGKPTFATLPPPERVVLTLAAAGLTDEQIGWHVHLSRSTVARVRNAGLTRWVALVWPPLEALK